MFTNERLFTIQAFTITRVHCISTCNRIDIKFIHYVYCIWMIYFLGKTKNLYQRRRNHFGWIHHFSNTGTSTQYMAKSFLNWKNVGWIPQNTFFYIGNHNHISAYIFHFFSHKVQVFWNGHKSLKKVFHWFWRLLSKHQNQCETFFKFCGLLTIF